MRIIKDRESHTDVSYLSCWDYDGERGWGFSFACDKEGNVKIEELTEYGRKNFLACMEGEVEGRKVHHVGIRQQVSHWSEPPVGECNCGQKVELGGFTNTCERCGRDYNFAGQELAPRSQWGEETGEHPSDIGRIP